jgi:hypothetical protein
LEFPFLRQENIPCVLSLIRAIQARLPGIAGFQGFTRSLVPLAGIGEELGKALRAPRVSEGFRARQRNDGVPERSGHFRLMLLGNVHAFWLRRGGMKQASC